MSDEEEEVVPKQKRLTKKGRHTLADSSSDEDEDLFGSDNDDESESEVGDALYSKESLKSAMDQVKEFIDPTPEFSSSLESWEDAKKLIQQEQFRFSDTGGLMKSLDGDLSLELKCFVAAVALQTCRIARGKNDRVMAQTLFKSKVKGDKSKHVGNYASNTWLQDSLLQLQKSTSVDDSKSNMHLNLLTTGLHFMEDCFVIDNAKKLNVLKEKQGMDWRGIATNISNFATSNNVDALADLATTINKYLSDFNPANKSSDAILSTPSAPPPKTTLHSSVDSQVLQDAAKNKREERMKNLRKKASYTSTMVVVPAASTTTTTTTSEHENNSWGPSRNGSSNDNQPWSAAPAPATSTAHGVMGLGSAAAASSASYASTMVAPVRMNSSSNDNHTFTAAPAPAPATTTGSSWNVNDNSTWNYSALANGASSLGAGSSADPPRSYDHASAYNNNNNNNNSSSWGADSSRNGGSSNQHDTNRGWGNDHSNVPARESANQSSWNNSNAAAWASASDYPSHGGSATSGHDSYHQSNSASSGRGYDAPLSSTYDNAPPPMNMNSTPVVNAGSADASSRDWNYPGASTANTSGSVPDNQLGGGGGGWNQPGGNYDRAPPPQPGGPPSNSSSKRSNNYDNQDNYQTGGRGGAGGKGNKRARQESTPAFQDNSQPGNGGIGRGRGRTLPAWMTKNNEGGIDPPAMPEPPRMGHNNNIGGPSGGLPARDLPVNASLQGTGRGRGRTLPAWMTQPNDNGPSSQGPALEPPRGPAPPSFGGESRNDLAGGGRGRGRTLPAWMTAQQNNNNGLGS